MSNQDLLNDDQKEIIIISIKNNITELLKIEGLTNIKLLSHCITNDTTYISALSDKNGMSNLEKLNIFYDKLVQI